MFLLVHQRVHPSRQPVLAHKRLQLLQISAKPHGFHLNCQGQCSPHKILAVYFHSFQYASPRLCSVWSEWWAVPLDGFHWETRQIRSNRRLGMNRRQRARGKIQQRTDWQIGYPPHLFRVERCFQCAVFERSVPETDCMENLRIKRHKTRIQYQSHSGPPATTNAVGSEVCYWSNELSGM